MALSAQDRPLIAWTMIFAVSQANIVRLLGPAGPRVLQIQTAWSALRYRLILDSMDAAATARFRSHYYPDFVHPAIYAMALRAGASRLGELTDLTPTTAKVLAVAPILSAAGDYVENIAGLYLLDHREQITDSVVRATTAVSVTKWVLALGTLAYLAGGFGRAIAGVGKAGGHQ
ncbi:hypothetical protein E5720_03730 [Rhodococcus sp. PAMC28707]|uniref:hypothetical protein n=1 Tax=unclassified Rhodococcus (in: high G+C Gram-positive bacteria) TaxID=192944 RepID=UPI00109E34A8|nr:MULTISPECIES: hypothetical protein [unclassified Rhodococcus (in: high G+C Gram-positive bacteria)]QCB50580.1 hypothetical protein E5769_10285 [Rhodococcus sp. PAMC28705]QCB57728.1 hypothetical protein E5720_03730 [Rhodococcus sp. PAMC28707]